MTSSLHLSKRATLLAASVCALLASGCGKDDANSQNTAPSYAFDSGTAFFEAYQELDARANCEAMFACPARQLDTLLNFGNTPDAEACTQAYLRSPLGAFERELFTSDRLTYDPAAGDACYKALQNAQMLGLCDLSATESRNLDAACDGFFSGAVSEGGNCLIDLECEEGLSCDGEVSAEACYSTCTAGPCGVCAQDEYCNGEACLPRLGENRICLSSDQCAEGLTCNNDTLMCEPAPAMMMEEPEEELPEIVRLNAPCRTFGATLILCEPGFVCRYASDSDAMGTCSPPGASGDACGTDSDCTYELRCEYDVDTGTGICVERGMPGAGMSCMVP